MNSEHNSKYVKFDLKRAEDHVIKFREIKACCGDGSLEIREVGHGIVTKIVITFECYCD